VTATAPGYAPLSKKSPSVTIGAGVFTAPTPTVTGRAVIGSVLTVKPGTWTPSATKTYRWLRNGVAISTATSASYKVAAVDYGKRLSVVVTGTATGYTTLKKTSASTATVVKPFTRTTAPTITGSVHVLSVLSAHRTAWSPYVSTYSWQWKRNGVAITGATGAAYRLTTADYGKKITVTLTGRRGGYATTLRTSAATFTVAGPAAVITKSGTYKVGTQIKPGTYAANSGPDCYWERDDASGYVGEGPGNVRGRTIVTIASTDKTFHTEGCGSWAPFVVLPGSATTAPSDGMYVVGSQVSAGTYTSTSTATCTWERLKDASGSDDSALGFGPFNERGRVIVTISSKDKYFATSGCGTWTKMPSTGTPAATAGDGMYAVGIHLQPGTYVNSGPAPVTCMASILTGFGGTMEEFLQGGITELPTSHKLQLTLLATDKGFFTSGCGTWTRIGP
jgi:hypothetical protein